MPTVSQDGTFHLCFPSDPTEVPRIQDQIESRLKQHQFEERDIFCIRLALEEALVNAIKHGNQLDRAKKVHVDCTIQGERFDIGIRDEGPGFDPADVPDPLCDENLERPCGRGLFLIKHYMTDVTFHAPGNRVTMFKICKTKLGEAHSRLGEPHLNGTGNGQYS